MEFIRPRKSSLGLDMTPMIDIVFQLLIFFMLSSSFLNPSLKLTLPKAIQQDQREPEKIVVSADKNGNIYVNTQKVPREQLKAQLENRFAGDVKKAVHLRGDAEMPYKFFVEIMDIARQAGAQQIHIVHETETSAR
ncbi:MAG: biopolymer transporter ExbD [Candidatus Omnitrophica bacterium]|nr:biopolymer transporter ExbD [Candidatus Omnitrophota bacterium]